MREQRDAVVLLDREAWQKYYAMMQDGGEDTCGKSVIKAVDDE